MPWFRPARRGVAPPAAFW